jgi:MOSC domain-containing protein YiiM
MRQVGDRFSIGTTVLEAVQPRLPCYKLGLRFGDQMMVKRFMRSGRFGTYFRVVTEGDVGAGDEVRLVHHDPASTPIVSMVNLRREA